MNFNTKNLVLGLVFASALVLGACTKKDAAENTAMPESEAPMEQTAPMDEAPAAAVCPEDVKTCSDGSTVVRSGEACEFDKCPDEM